MFFRRSSVFQECGATMTKVGGGLLKLDAICAKLQTNLKTRQVAPGQEEIQAPGQEEIQAPGQEEIQAPGQEEIQNNDPAGHCDEPNNNTDALNLIKDNILTACGDSCHENDVHDDDDFPNEGPEHSADLLVKTGNLNFPSPNPVEQAMDGMTEVTPEGSSSGGGRKSRRKAQRPRSIANIAAEQAKEELSEYEENNPDVDFGNICEAAMEEEEEDEEERLLKKEEERLLKEEEERLLQEEEERLLQEEEERLLIYDNGDDQMDDYSLEHSDNDSHMSYHDQSHDQRYPEPSAGRSSDRVRSVDCNDNDCGVLDLSVARKTSIYKPIEDNDEDDDEDDFPEEENGVLNLSVTPRKMMHVPNICDKNKLKPKSRNDVTEMKNYAENTMNELLSMYGLGGEGETISSRIPLRNFDPGSILGRSPLEMMKAGVDHRPLAAARGQRSYDQPIMAKKMKMDLDDEEDDGDLMVSSPG